MEPTNEKTGGNTDKVRGVVYHLVAKATQLGLDWESELTTAGPGPYTARQVVNAIGEAATKAGVPNNLVKP